VVSITMMGAGTTGLSKLYQQLPCLLVQLDRIFLVTTVVQFACYEEKLTVDTIVSIHEQAGALLNNELFSVYSELGSSSFTFETETSKRLAYNNFRRFNFAIMQSQKDHCVWRKESIFFSIMVFLFSDLDSIHLRQELDPSNTSELLNSWFHRTRIKTTFFSKHGMIHEYFQSLTVSCWP